MRRFLYLNDDSIISFISQISDGLPTKITTTSTLSEETEKEKKLILVGK